MEVYGSRINVQTTDELVYDKSSGSSSSSKSRLPQPHFLKDSSRADSTLSQISGISYTDSSSGELVRILLAPYMSPFIVSLKKVKTWESLVKVLQRMFGEPFCSLENPPYITNYYSEAVIEEEQWSKGLKPDLTIVVHNSKMHKKTSSSSKAAGHPNSPSCELLSTGGTVVAIGMESPTHQQQPNTTPSSSSKQKSLKRELSLQNLLMAAKRTPKHGKSTSDGLPPQHIPPPPLGADDSYNYNQYGQLERPPLKSVFESYDGKEVKDSKPKNKMGKKLWGAMVSVFKDHSEHEHNNTNTTSNNNNSSNHGGGMMGGQEHGHEESQPTLRVANFERARPKKRKGSKRNSKIQSASTAKRNSRRMDVQGQTVVVVSHKDRKNKDFMRISRKKRRSHQMSPVKKRSSVERSSAERSVRERPRVYDDELASSPAIDTYSPSSTAVEDEEPSSPVVEILKSPVRETSPTSLPSKQLPPTPVSPVIPPFSPPPTRAPPPPPRALTTENLPRNTQESDIPSPPPSPVEIIRPLTINREREPVILESLTSPPLQDVPIKHRRTLSKGSITSIRPRLSLRTSANSLKEMAARHLRSDSWSRSHNNNNSISPPIPPRPKESVGVNAQYGCLDEEIIRKTVEELMNGIKQSVGVGEEVTMPVEPTSATKEKSSKSKSKTGESPRRRRRGTTSSSTDPARPDSRSSRRTTRSRAESLSATGNPNRHSNMPHDGKPLPKLPYKFSPFPAPMPTTPTYYPTSPLPPLPSSSSVSIKNGQLPPIAPFEELVRNTRSYSDAANRERPSTAGGRQGSISSSSGYRFGLQRNGSNASATTAVTAMTSSER